jgi:hypothetical protein
MTFSASDTAITLRFYQTERFWVLGRRSLVIPLRAVTELSWQPAVIPPPLQWGLSGPGRILMRGWFTTRKKPGFMYVWRGSDGRAEDVLEIHIKNRLIWPTFLITVPQQEADDLKRSWQGQHRGTSRPTRPSASKQG